MLCFLLSRADCVFNSTILVAIWILKLCFYGYVSIALLQRYNLCHFYHRIYFCLLVAASSVIEIHTSETFRIIMQEEKELEKACCAQWRSFCIVIRSNSRVFIFKVFCTTDGLIKYELRPKAFDTKA
ncbi:hypothetical protein BD770DRAFT_415421 [Pilaira anomala]|nr:hypothetical protein BD770DRAFT_415421 [Pilaira anomala]